ncbi:MAG: 2-oxoacid:acceptor oxidoreductase subunit alpha [Candidatus Beckwithbacteria bacterium]
MPKFNWKMIGSAGEGIKISGLIMASTCFQHGLYVHGYTEYPSLIRGGTNTFQLTADLKPVLSASNLTDLEVSTSDPLFLKICQENHLNSKSKNMVALGFSAAFFNLDLSILTSTIAKTFSKKSKVVIKENQKAAEFGYKTNSKRFNKILKPLPSVSLSNQIFLTGNEALSLGAIAGGMKFFSAYPMTPATSILHFLASKALKANLAVRQGEDEIGVVNMALGASFAGARTMVATSGGGFSLMTECLGLAGVSETPLVIVDAMRPGPASGMPTWTGQGDLLFCIHASQDEFPRIVLAPGDPQEAFILAKLAQNLAEKYQLPVIILTDKYLAESYFTFTQPETNHNNQRFGIANTTAIDNQTPFHRYAVTDTGVSLRSLPGQSGGIHLANSYEHDTLGYATEVSETRIKQVNKRAKKLITLLSDSDMVKPTLYGPQNAVKTVISWGSNKGSCLTALDSLPDTNFIHFSWVFPFPQSEFLRLIKSSKKLITLEANSTGQLNQLIQKETGIKIESQILKYDGRPFFPEEIIAKVKSI